MEPRQRGPRLLPALAGRLFACLAWILSAHPAIAQEEITAETLEPSVARVVAAQQAAAERIELGQACLAFLEDSPDPRIEKDLRLALGIALHEQERFAEAWEQLAVASRLARDAEDATTLAHSLWLQGVSAFHLGQLEDAVVCATEGLEAAERADWDEAHWRIANILGLAEERRGRSEQALEAYRRGQESAQRVVEATGNREGLYVLRGNIGIVYMNLGELEQALELYERTVEMLMESPNQDGLHAALANMGDVLILMGRLDEAEGYLLEALELRRELGSETELALSFHSLGALLYQREDHEAALAEFEKALEIRQRLDLAPEAAATLAAMAHAYAALDRDDEALDSAQRSLELTDRLALKGRRLAILEALAAAHVENGEHELANEVYRQATALEREQRSMETSLRLADFRATYEMREKEHEIALLSRERDLQDLSLQQQRFQRNALLIGGVFVGLAAVAGWIMVMSLRRALNRVKNLEQDRLRTEQLESIGLLAGGIAHDFNNILAAVVGNLSLLRMQEPEDESARELLSDAEQALDQGQQLSTQLLSLAKGGALALELHPLDALIRQATGLALSGSSSRAEVTIQPELWNAEVDAGQVRQLLSNLVLNAVQAMPTGGTVRVQAENVDLGPGNPDSLPPGPYVRIVVLDQGTGIPAALEEKVFYPYFTTKESGSGLGLALAYAIVSRHEGAISYRSNESGGTTFQVLLPAAPSAAKQDKSPSEPLRTGKGRILVMDDDPLIRNLYRRTLKKLGYTCELVKDGRDAIALFARSQRDGLPFQLAILDLTIPGGMGGKETMQQLHALDPALRAIVVSGYSDDRILENHREAGFFGALPKPFTIEALSRIVEEATRSGPVASSG